MSIYCIAEITFLDTLSVKHCLTLFPLECSRTPGARDALFIFKEYLQQYIDK